jgi:hypothetical protein
MLMQTLLRAGSFLPVNVPCCDQLNGFWHSLEPPDISQMGNTQVQYCEAGFCCKLGNSKLHQPAAGTGLSFI